MFDVCEGCGEEVEVNEFGFCIACVGGELLESPMADGVDLFGPGAPFEKKEHSHKVGRPCSRCAEGKADDRCWNCGNSWCEGCHGPSDLGPDGPFEDQLDYPHNYPLNRDGEVLF